MPTAAPQAAPAHAARSPTLEVRAWSRISAVSSGSGPALKPRPRTNPSIGGSRPAPALEPPRPSAAAWSISSRISARPMPLPFRSDAHDRRVLAAGVVGVAGEAGDRRRARPRGSARRRPSRGRSRAGSAGAPSPRGSSPRCEEAQAQVLGVGAGEERPVEVGVLRPDRPDREGRAVPHERDAARRRIGPDRQVRVRQPAGRCRRARSPSSRRAPARRRRRRAAG